MGDYTGEYSNKQIFKLELLEINYENNNANVALPRRPFYYVNRNKNQLQF
jgi:hypothetical protein